MSESTGTTGRALRGLVALVTLAVVSTACGTSGTGSSTSGASGSAPIVGECQSKLADARKPLTWTAPGPPLRAADLRGKKVMFLSLAQSVPTIAQVASATQAAGKLVGIDVSVYDTAGSVTRMQQGIQQAIDTKFSAIILLGIPLAPTAAMVKKAHDAGITLVSELNNQPDPSMPGQGAGANIFGSTGPDYNLTGQLLACKAVVDTGGKADAVIFGVDELTTAAPPEVGGMETILKQCPGCTYTKNSTPVAAWQTDLASKAASVVQANPSVNYLLPLYDGMALFMVSGVKQAGAGSRVKIASFNAVPAALSMVRQGGPLVADPGQPSTWMAWQGLDQAMRGMLGMHPGTPTVPVHFFDTTNINGVDINDETALFGDGFRAGFTQLWGLKG